MDMPTVSTTQYLTTLFDLEDHICISQSVYTNHVQKVSDIISTDKNYEYVSINPFKEGTTRAARNVNKYRNFIIEFEDDEKGIPLDKQRDVVDKLKMPFTSQVYSGGKSMHFVISLETPLKTREEWEEASQWLYSILVPYKVDPACKDVGRFTRVGGGVRVSKDKVQTIVELNNRVNNDTFYNWLSKFDRPTFKRKYSTNHKAAHHISLFGEKFDKSFRGRILKDTLNFIRTGGTKGQRHMALFKAACDLRDQRYTLKEAKKLLLTNLHKTYIIENKEGEMFKHVNTIEDAYFNYKPNPPRF